VGLGGALATLSTSMAALNINQKIFQRVRHEPAATGKSRRASKVPRLPDSTLYLVAMTSSQRSRRVRTSFFPSPLSQPFLHLPSALPPSQQVRVTPGAEEEPHIRGHFHCWHRVRTPQRPITPPPISPQQGEMKSQRAALRAAAAACWDGWITRVISAGTDASPCVFHLLFYI